MTTSSYPGASAPRVARVDSDNRDDLWSFAHSSPGNSALGVGVAALMSDATETPSPYWRFVAGPIARCGRD